MKNIDHTNADLDRDSHDDHTKRGNVLHEKTKCRHATKSWTKPPQVKKVARAIIQDTELWADVYMFRRVDRVRCFAAIPASLSSRSEQVLKHLADLGLAGTNHPSIRNVVATAVNTDALKLGTILIRGGWIGAPGEQFALPDQIVSGPDHAQSGREYFLAPNFDLMRPAQLVSRDGSVASSHLSIARQGTTTDWKRSVATLALNSSAMMLAISASIAAPFLKLVNETPFSIMFTGPSSGGKTTITLASASFIGIGTELELANWNVTAAGLEQRAEIHSDLCLHIDDIKNFSGSDREAFKLIKEVAYRITAGSKKMTQTRAKSATTARPPMMSHGVSTIIVTSSENSLDKLAQSAGDAVPDGVRVRFLEIPVAESRNGGVFDLYKERCSQADLTKARAKLATDIAKSCNRCHGSVLRKLLKAITHDPKQAAKRVKRYRRDFIDVVELDRRDPLQLRHANRFGFLFGAAAYAIDQELLPWTHKQLRSAILKCHAASSARILTSPAGHSEPTLDDGLARLKRLLRDQNRIVSRPESMTGSAVAVWKTVENGRRLFYVAGPTWRGVFASKAQRTGVERLLIKQGSLRSDANGPITVQPRIGKGNKRTSRCYELSFPVNSVRKPVMKRDDLATETAAVT